MGRPRSEMTEEKITAILNAVRLGVWPDRAAEMHGVAKSTMRMHRKRNPEFATAIKEAEAAAEASVYGKILRHMDDQWTAAAWMLERRWPDRWAKRDRHEVEHSGGLSVQVVTGVERSTPPENGVSGSRSEG